MRDAELGLATAQEAVALARQRAQRARWQALRVEREAERPMRPKSPARPSPPPDSPPPRVKPAVKPARSPVKRATQQQRAAAVAALGALLPKRITAAAGKRRRTIQLAAGELYRVEPLNPAKKRNRGRRGRLLTWDVAGTAGVIEWSDDHVREQVPLVDLVKAESKS